MFKKLIKNLFNANKAEANYFSFEKHREKKEQALSSDPSTAERISPHLKLESYTPVSLEDKVQHEFFSYLFGTSSVNHTSDELTDYVADKVSSLLAQPENVFNVLPPLPESLTELLEQLKNEEFDTELIVSSIEKEPLVVAKVIELANNSYYNRSGNEVIHLKKAFMLLGAQGLMEGVINAFVNQMTPMKKSYFKMYGAKIWEHSELSGRISKELAKNTSLSENVTITYFGALLSNLGDMIIYQLLIEAFSYVHPNCQPDTLAFRKLMSLNSKGLTYCIARYWQLPNQLTECLESQLSITDKNSLTLAQQQSPVGALVYEARLLAMLELMFEANAIDEELLERANSLVSSSAAKFYILNLLNKDEENDLK